ncbi:hypothetical protein Y032_0018g3558 [Ancylostoma ceylanicum]|uniref:Uncharacterized protein n=1 Tax=Ancylostoma ceylanicum TaxID=53326 RepID=A0A016V2Z5_9BILA|nr:hypothetical protein Y032_0018g3558 [Ancylostoma ceylanicum]
MQLSGAHIHFQKMSNEDRRYVHKIFVRNRSQINSTANELKIEGRTTTSEAEPLPGTSKRPASTMFDRRSKIPLHVQVGKSEHKTTFNLGKKKTLQLMMASGPVNGREVVYYPWDNGKGMEGRRSKESQGEKAKNKMDERKSAQESQGIVQV